MAGQLSQHALPILTSAAPTFGSLNEHLQASILLNNHLGMLMSMAKGHSDVIIKGHDPQGPAGLLDHISVMAMLCNSSSEQGQHSGFHQTLPILLVFQASMAHTADPTAGEFSVSGVLCQCGHEKLQALGVQEVRLTISQHRQGIESLEQKALVACGSQLPSRQKDWVGPLLGCQVAAGFLLPALVTEAGKVGGYLLEPSAGQGLLQITESLRRMSMLVATHGLCTTWSHTPASGPRIEERARSI